jgi:phage-related protein
MKMAILQDKEKVRAWPLDFPVRFAEVVSDYTSDLYYNVIYDGTAYVPFPVNLSGYDTGVDGKINELTLTVFNVDNIMSSLVEDPFLVGNNIFKFCYSYS